MLSAKLFWMKTDITIYKHLFFFKMTTFKQVVYAFVVGYVKVKIKVLTLNYHQNKEHTTVQHHSETKRTYCDVLTN